MYRVLLADDEPDVRDGLLQEIDWTACGFTVVGTAENGQEATELAERLEPDAVVTDISMPFMDGLKLAEWLRERYPLVKIVILTGYDEFDYARQAVRLSVDDYLLKPFSAASLNELLCKLRGKMDRERAEREDVKQLKEHFHTSLPLLQATFLASLLYRKQSRAAVDARAAGYGLSLSGSGGWVSLISLHAMVQPDEAAPAYSLRSSEDLDLKLFAVMNIAEEIWGRLGLGYVFLHQDYVVLLSVNRDGREAWLWQTQQALESVLRNIEHYLRVPVTIGAGSIVSCISDLKVSYEDALLALDYRLVPGAGNLIFIEDVERGQAQKLRFDELKERSLVRCLKVGTAEELREIIDTIFREISGDHAYSDIQLYLIEVMTSVLKTAEAADVNTDEIFGPGFPFYAEMFKFSGLPQAQLWFHERCMMLMNRIASKRQHNYKDIVEQAVAYIQQNYGDPDISIQKLISLLHISQGYFCGIFKKEVKMTFVQYLMQIRMEAAKELLRTTDLKAFEIAERVGFTEPNYFSYCFKKQIGVSPKEYRTQSGMTVGR
ncbi:response regulator [Paenibacillus beijingensis]|uniref:Transcriptional regulator n=1 Tax=Paenibacillus beijingensis TaxID=1126833 RepID=A0A0D5NPR0_9BACL|nr:response regulator [Paenibacillus beijingensis]AJY76918.1 transcriptional regulator [Paenibacillus beijingensis]